MKIRTEKVIDVSEWDRLVEETYNRPYAFQQQDGCKDRGNFRFTVPSEEVDDFENDSVPENVNHKEMGVSFAAWLKRNINDPLSGEMPRTENGSLICGGIETFTPHFKWWLMISMQRDYWKQEIILSILIGNMKELEERLRCKEIELAAAETSLRQYHQRNSELVAELKKKDYALTLLTIGTCNCLTKTPDPKFHKMTCIYKIAKEALGI